MAEVAGGWSWLSGKFYAVLRRNPPSNRVVAELAALDSDDRVLDIGCGAGAAMVLAAQTVDVESVAGVDPTAALASTARSRLPGARVEVAVAEDLPFPDESFTVVWTISSHHHWDDSRAGLAEVRRVLKPDGRLLLAEAWKRREEGHGLTDGEAERLKTTLGEVGFEKVEVVRTQAGRRKMLVLIAHRP
jgi:ubiquinone/menaquinone biosynthesis C-methylase UbiE